MHNHRVLFAYNTKPDFPERLEAIEAALGWTPVAIVTAAAHVDRLSRRHPSIPVCDKDDFSTAILPIQRCPLSARSLADDMAYIEPHATQIFSMMERTAHPDDLTFRMRRRYLRKLVHEVGSMLDDVRPDIVHFGETPHGTAFYVVYLLSQRRRIPTVWFVPTGFPGYNMVGETVGSVPVGTADCEACEDIPAELLDRLESLRSPVSFNHWYMDGQAKYSLPVGARPTATLAKLMSVHKWPAYLRHVSNSRRERLKATEWLGQPNQFRGHYQFTPLNHRASENRHYQAMVDERTRFKRELSAEYAKRTSGDLDLTAPYVYFPLHFQPERTTNPEGGTFRDQFIAIAMIHDALPAGWLLYVKEHPTQFHENPLYASEKGREVADYDDLLELKSVRLAPVNTSSADLVRNSRATATITGTAAWEAAVNGVPGLHFAHTWYDGFPGTRFIADFDSLERFLAEIERYEATSADAEREYLRRFLGRAFRFEICAQDMPDGMVDRAVQVDACVKALDWWQRQHFDDSLVDTA